MVGVRHAPGALERSKRPWRRPTVYQSEQSCPHQSWNNPPGSRRAPRRSRPPSSCTLLTLQVPWPGTRRTCCSSTTATNVEVNGEFDPCDARSVRGHVWSSANSRRPDSESAYLVANQAYISLRISNASHTSGRRRAAAGALLGAGRDCTCPTRLLSRRRSAPPPARSGGRRA